MAVGSRMMRGSALLAVAALGACVLPRSRSVEDGVFTSEGIASFDSFRCAQSAVSGMGYTVNWYDGGEETLRAERRYEGSAESYRGYLTVSVTDESSGRSLLVRAERFADASALPIPARPSPQPTPTPTPVPLPRASSQRGSRRVSPGPVAGDARNVVRRCAMAGGRSYAAR